MTVIRRSPILVTGTVIGLLMGAAGLVGGDPPWRAALTSAITIGYALLITLLARRSETFSVLAGRPVDERWQYINMEASTWALGVTAIVALAAFTVAEATHGDWQPYAFICVVIAASYVGSLVFLRLRG